MARPKLYDYDPGSEEEIVLSGTQAAEMTWFGIDIGRQVIHIVCQEGLINGTNDGLEAVTKKGQQVTLEGAEVAIFYQANKAAIDSIISAAYAAWADKKSKTGTVIVA